MTQLILRICKINSQRCLTWFRVYWTSTNTDFPQGFTNLMLVSYFGLSTAVKHLLKIDSIDLNSQDNTYQWTALSWAAGKGFDDVVKLLINNASISRRVFKQLIGQGTQINLKDKYGRTPLSYADWTGNVAVVQRLLTAGAWADFKDEIGGTPLSYAVCNGYMDIVKLLLKEDTQADLRDISKELLFSAAKKGHEDVVNLLLDKGNTDLGGRHHDGQTPILWAAKNGHWPIVKLLLATKKVNINAKDKAGWTLLSHAIEGECEDMVELLLKAGADFDYEYTNTVSKPTLSLVHTSVESIADPGVSGCYSV